MDFQSVLLGPGGISLGQHGRIGNPSYMENYGLRTTDWGKHVAHDAERIYGGRFGRGVRRWDDWALSSIGGRSKGAHGTRHLEGHPAGTGPEHRDRRQGSDDHPAGLRPPAHPR